MILGGGPVLPTLQQATSTIPVVMVGAADPVSQGFAQSLARLAGNFTGLSLQLVETTWKRLELLNNPTAGWLESVYVFPLLEGTAVDAMQLHLTMARSLDRSRHHVDSGRDEALASLPVDASAQSATDRPDALLREVGQSRCL